MTCNICLEEDKKNLINCFYKCSISICEECFVRIIKDMTFKCPQCARISEFDPNNPEDKFTRLCYTNFVISFGLLKEYYNECYDDLPDLVYSDDEVMFVNSNSFVQSNQTSMESNNPMFENVNN